MLYTQGYRFLPAIDIQGHPYVQRMPVDLAYRHQTLLILDQKQLHDYGNGTM